MKVFIFALLIAAVAADTFRINNREDLIRARKECIVELGVDAATVEGYQKKIFPAEGVTPCYIRCVFIRLGLFSEASGFLTENYIAQLGRGEGTREGVTGCYDNSGADTCLWAYRAFGCFGRGGLLPEGY